MKLQIPRLILHFKTNQLQIFMAADNFFGIETLSVDENATDSLFGEPLDGNADDLKGVEAAKAEAAVKAKQAEEAKKKAAEEAAKKAEETKKKGGVVPPKTKEELEVEETLNPEDTLFGEAIKEENEVGEEDPENETQEDEKEKNQFEILSESLYKAGVFQPEIDEDGEETIHVAKTPEEFKKLFEVQKEVGMYQMINNYLSRHGQDRQELFDAIFEKGVDPKEYLPIYNSIQTFENLTLESEENQEKVVREFYKRSNIPEDKISKKIQTLKDTAYLQEEAETFHPQIVAQDKAAAKKQEDDKQAATKAEEARDSQYKASIAKILTEKMKAKEFDGIPLTEKRAQQAYDYLYNKKWQSPDGKKYTDFDKFVLELNKPENHALKVKAGLLFLENLDLTKVKNKAVSDETNELFSEFTTKKVKKANKQKTAASAAWNNL